MNLSDLALLCIIFASSNPYNYKRYIKSYDCHMTTKHCRTVMTIYLFVLRPSLGAHITVERTSCDFTSTAITHFLTTVVNRILYNYVNANYYSTCKFTYTKPTPVSSGVAPPKPSTAQIYVSLLCRSPAQT